MTKKVWILDGDVAKTVLGLFSVRLLIMWNKRSLYRLFYVDVISLAQMQNELQTKEVREQLVWQNRSYFFFQVLCCLVGSEQHLKTFENYLKLNCIQNIVCTSSSPLQFVFLHPYIFFPTPLIFSILWTLYGITRI